MTSTQWRLLTENVGRRKFLRLRKKNACEKLIKKKRAAAHDTALGLGLPNSVIRHLQRCRAYRDGLKASDSLQLREACDSGLAGQSFRLARVLDSVSVTRRPSLNVWHAVNTVKFRG